MTPRLAIHLAAVLALTLADAGQLPAQAASQAPRSVGGRSEVFAGGEMENYLRALQLTGQVPLYPWSVRAFSPREVDSLVPREGTHPWARRYDLAPRSPSRGLWVDLVRPRVTLIENTGFPFGRNDGPVWAGRGLTTVVQAGVALRYGRYSATLAPLLFRAENAAFALMPNGHTGKMAYADGQAPGTIDRPQRFGPGPYTVLDPGQSTVRVDLGRITAGVSTASQVWGPADQSPLILSNNAAGYPAVFLATSRPLDVWIGRIHGRLVYGDLRQSAYSGVTGRASRRFAPGLVAVLEPRATRGLELGLARFFHRSWPPGGPGWNDLTRPFHAILKSWHRSIDDSVSIFADPDNQLISIFGRLVLPANSIEVYAEFAREDNARDVRDLLAEPDHDVGYTMGFRRAWRHSATRLVVVRAEMMNTRVSGLQRGDRGESPFYRHGEARQGHTYRGQIVGAADGYGGAAATVAVDVYSQRGRWTVEWNRALRGIRGWYPLEAATDSRGVDVAHTLAASVLLFREGLDLSAGLSGTLELNRDFGRNAANLNAFLGVRADLGRPRR